MRVLENRHGRIPEGTQVYFQVENQDQWIGDTHGVLAFDEKADEWVIDTNFSGRIRTKGYLTAYINTIRPLSSAERATLA